MLTDYAGQPLIIGDHVEAWLDGIRYEGTVTEIRQRHQESDNYRWITVRDRNGDLHETFSDAVRILR